MGGNRKLQLVGVGALAIVASWGGLSLARGPRLAEARQGFKTTIVTQKGYTPAGPPEPPPAGVFQLVRYSSPAGKLAAYVTPDPRDGKRRPAVVWAHGGFGGIGDWLFERGPLDNDQSASVFREAGMVLMCPSWRGENDNPGKFEMFYGEVDDFLAARDYVARLPYVDPERIYLAGHSTGGTITLLAACLDDRFRAAFSLGGAADMERVMRGGGYGNTPFDASSETEVRLRSATSFVRGIRRPTFYFEGAASPLGPDALSMHAASGWGLIAPFRAYVIAGRNHFDLLSPLLNKVAAKIGADTGATCNIRFTLAEREIR